VPPDFTDISNERRASRLARRRRVLVAVALVACLVSAGAVGVSTRLKSPAQAAAEAEAPQATVLTAPVARRVLASTVVMRGAVTAARRVEVTPTAAFGASQLVVTGVRVRPGTVVGKIQVLLEVSGRPVIALPGRIPAYRDLKPGDDGKDVAQLQRALTSFGLDVSDRDGKYGSSTKAAVGELYRRLGFSAPLAGDADAVESSRASVREARRRLEQAERLVADRAQAVPPDEAQIRYAREDLRTAQRGLSESEALSGPTLPMSEAVYLPSLPARVSSVAAAVGGPVKQPLLVLETGALVVTGELLPADAGLVKPGMAVDIEAESLNAAAKGLVQRVGGSAPNAESIKVAIAPRSALSAQWGGHDVRITVTAARTSAPVLVVPLAALSTGADGITTVTALKGGAQSRVQVTAGASAGGYVEVRPLPGQALVATDDVVVG
jgi:hypothetical protein